MIAERAAGGADQKAEHHHQRVGELAPRCRQRLARLRPAQPRQRGLREIDRQRRCVGGHHIGRAKARHQQPHQRALQSHRHQPAQRRAQRNGIVGRPRRRSRHAGDEQHRQQDFLDRQRQQQRAAPSHGRDDHRGDDTAEQKDRDRQHLHQHAGLRLRPVRTDGDEAAGGLRDVETEQSEEDQPVDEAGGDAERERDDARYRQRRRYRFSGGRARRCRAGHRLIPASASRECASPLHASPARSRRS